jgi:hypothetical protein
MPDADFGVVASGLQGSNGVNITALFLVSTLAGSCSVAQGATGGGGGGFVDSALCCVTIFR